MRSKKLSLPKGVDMTTDILECPFFLKEEDATKLVVPKSFLGHFGILRLACVFLC
jgi:hypothetical protein